MGGNTLAAVEHLHRTLGDACLEPHAPEPLTSNCGPGGAPQAEAWGYDAVRRLLYEALATDPSYAPVGVIGDEQSIAGIALTDQNITEALCPGRA